MTKKITKILTIQILVVLAILLTYVFETKPKDKYFKLDVTFNQEVFEDNDLVEVNAVFTNTSLGYYKIFRLHNLLYIEVYTNQEDKPSYLTIGIVSHINPFYKLKKEESFNLDIKEVYYIIVFYVFTIDGQEYKQSKEFNIIEGKLITAS